MDIIVARVSGVPPNEKGQKESKSGRKLRRIADLTAGGGGDDREQPADFPRIILTVQMLLTLNLSRRPIQRRNSKVYRSRSQN